jgi:hypothetical protein
VNVPAQGDSLRIEVSTTPVKQITMALDPTLLSKVVSVFYSDSLLSKTVSVHSCLKSA